MGQRFHDGAEIEKPLREMYKGTYIDSVFVIAFHKNENKRTFTLKLRRNGADGKLLLVGNARADDKRHKQETSFHLVKINDDISAYVKPEKGRIEVTTAPPPKTGHWMRKHRIWASANKSCMAQEAHDKILNQALLQLRIIMVPVGITDAFLLHVLRQRFRKIDARLIGQADQDK